MNRRSFIGAVIASCIAPKLLLNQEFKWKLTKTASGLFVPNPEWVTAPYEVAFLYCYDGAIVKPVNSPMPEGYRIDPYLKRCKDINGNELIPAYIEA